MVLFIAQAIVFTVRSNSDYYKTNTELRDQYVGMVMAESGMGGGQAIPFDAIAPQIHQTYSQVMGMPEEQRKMYATQDPSFQKQFEMIERLHGFILYLEGKTEDECTKAPAVDPYQQMMMQQAAPEDTAAPMENAAETDTVNQ